MLNTEITTKTIIAVLISDVILLLTMLVGLLRLRMYGTMFGLAQFLWKQVGCEASRPYRSDRPFCVERA